VDKFFFKLADLGELSELEIWHDGAGLGAGWCVGGEGEKSCERQEEFRAIDVTK
jgi:hypothetical protein